MSWNSSTQTCRKRSCSRSRIDRVVAEQVACTQLEILEVERRLAVLRRSIGALEALEQGLEQLPVARGDGVQRRLLQRLPGLLVVVVLADGVAGKVEQRLGLRPAVEELDEPGCLVAVARSRPGRARAPRPGSGRRRATAPAAGRPPAGSRRRRSACGEAPPSRTWRAAPAGRRLRRRRTRRAPLRTPRREERQPGSRRAHGSAGRARRRTDAASAGAGRTRGSSRSRRRPGHASGRVGRARQGATGSVPAARPPRARCR